jgi:type IV pilus assembly protein PilC
MKTFVYTALDAKGASQEGTMDGTDQNSVLEMLRGMGLYPTRVIPAGEGVVAKRGKRAAKTVSVQVKSVPRETLIDFTRGLAEMQDAGLPILKALSVLLEEEANQKMKRVISTIVESISGGSTFSEALGLFPGVFDKSYVGTVKAGEAGGTLNQALMDLANLKESAEKVRSKVKSAMTYPAVVLTIAVGITFFLVTFIVPKFAKIFEDMLGQGQQLPALTQMVMAISNFCQNMLVPPYLWYLLGFIVLVATLVKMIQRSEKALRVIDVMLLALPFIGQFSRHYNMAKFARFYGVLVDRGVPPLQALDILAKILTNRLYAEASLAVKAAIKEGEDFTKAIKAFPHLFSPRFVGLAATGEETGRQGEMLLKVATLYEDKINRRVESLTRIIEPIMIVLLSVIVGTIVIALFLPLIEIIKRMQGGSAG